jgi:hypothetical protein
LLRDRSNGSAVRRGRQICTARDHAISRHCACARGGCDDALTCEYREIVRRSGFSSRAEPGAISSSRCQTTRTRSGGPDRVRNHCFWTSRALPEATRMKRKKAQRHTAGKDRSDTTASTRGDRRSGGARRDRTDDLLLAKQALSQLSYGPSGAQTTEGGGQTTSAVRRLYSVVWELVGLGRFELPTSRLSSARSNQLSYKPAPGFRSQSSPVQSSPVVSGQIRPSRRDGASLETDVRSPTSDHRPLAWARPRRKRNVDGGVPLSGDRCELR